MMKPGSELQAFLDAAVDGVVLMDHRGTIEALNRAAGRLFGYKTAEVLGANIGLLMPGTDTGSHKGREVEGRRKDGTVFPVFLSVGVMEGTQPPRCVGFVSDISLRRRAEEDTYRLQERLTHVSRLATVGEMSAGIAHELNQPLTAVANYSQACDRLLALPNPDIAEIREALQQITAQAVRAGDIIRRLRTLARNDIVQRELTDVNVLVTELHELIQLDAKTWHVSYHPELTPDLPQVEVDRAQLQQVIVNLVRNAVEALAEDKHPENTRQVSLHTRLAPQGEVEIAVCDNGPGLSRAVSARLFDPFCSTKPNGTGLGLAISRTIIKSHQGSLEHRPNSPRGACFIVRLPLPKQD
jgi:two-component system sensor kinase FixL